MIMTMHFAVLPSPQNAGQLSHFRLYLHWLILCALIDRIDSKNSNFGVPAWEPWSDIAEYEGFLLPQRTMAASMEMPASARNLSCQWSSTGLHGLGFQQEAIIVMAHIDLSCLHGDTSSLNRVNPKWVRIKGGKHTHQTSC